MITRSSPRKRGTQFLAKRWMPAFAGMSGSFDYCCLSPSASTSSFCSLICCVAYFS
jgi:hypothetical protein